jgi:AraC-like DNA-binding protein
MTVRGAAPRGVVTAIRFMQRSLARPLTTREIAAAAGMPERSLRRQFQRFTGQSPIAFHRHLRLEAARLALSDSQAKADITTAASMHGFSHFSHFAGQYRRRYGELPSATLRITRESSLPLPLHAVREPASLIVLPFVSTDPDASTAVVAEMMTDGVISALTATRWLNVLSRSTDLPAADNIRVAPHRARYAVRGRVQCIGGIVQVVVRLSDLTTGRQIWGNAFEGTAGCTMELGRRVTEAVANAVPTCLRDVETTQVKGKPVRDPDATHCATQAFHAALEMTQSANGRALEYLDRAHSIDPKFPFASALSAWCHAQRAGCCFGDTANADRDKARHLTALTLSMDNEDPMVLAVLGHASTICADLDLGTSLIEKCLAIDPCCLMAWQRRGWLGVYRGAHSALADFNHALALNPSGPERFNTILGISQAHFLTGNYEEAADWAARGLRERPHETWARRIAAVAQVRCGQMAAGRRSALLLQRQYPDISVGTIINALPTMPAELLARQAEALESAGLPI